MEPETLTQEKAFVCMIFVCMYFFLSLFFTINLKSYSEFIRNHRQTVGHPIYNSLLTFITVSTYFESQIVSDRGGIG